MAVTNAQFKKPRNKSVIVKPVFSNGGGGYVSTKPGNYTVTNAQGQTVDSGNFGGKPGEAGYKDPSGYVAGGNFGPGHTINIGGESYSVGDVGSAGQRYDIGDPGADGVSSVRAGNKGAIGSVPGIGSLGALGTFAGPGNLPLPKGAVGGGISGVGAYPYYLSEGYPDYPTIDYKPIESAPYNKTDAQKFAKSFGDFNRAGVKDNFRTSQELALNTLSTELEGLKGFLPETTNIYRKTLSDDNAQNQAFRTNQVDSLLPDARDTLERQRQRMETYASGKLPDSVADAALNLGMGSRSADQGIAAGFGAKSMQTNKLANLMSAEERFQIAQYGEGGIGSNLGTRADLYMAPLKYGNASDQIRLNPEVGAGRVAQSVFGAMNSATLLSPGQAFQSEIQQEQFVTNQEQNTRTFNATNTLSTDKFNSEGIWDSKVGQFNYDASYLASVQGANQSNLNFAAAMMLQAMQAGAAGTGMAAGQQGDSITSGLGSLGTFLGDLATNSNKTTPSSDGGSNSGGGNSGNTNSSSSAVPQQSPLPSISAPDAAGPVGGTTIDSSPSNDTGGSQGGQMSQQQPASLDSGSSTNPNLKATSIEPSSPGGLRFAADTPAPSGYVASGPTENGSYPVAPTSQYEGEAARFAQFAGMPTQDVSIGDLAVADRNLTQAGGMSYIPVQGFQPMALSNGGKQIYANPTALNSQDAQIGQTNIASIGTDLAMMGIEDPAVHGALSKVISAADGNPEQRQELVSQALESGTPAGQRFAYGMMKIQDMDKHLSPGQKSNMMSSLTNDYVEATTGKNVKEMTIPSTEKALLPPLKVKDVVKLEASGANAKSLARGWDQMSVFGAMVGKTTDTKEIYNINAKAGLTGYGPQGASVPVDAKRLASVSQAAPELGVGARTFTDRTKVPNGFTVVGKAENGNFVAVPQNLARTSPLNNTAAPETAYKKTAMIAAGQHKAQAFWQPTKDQGSIRGSAGGSAIVSAFETMVTANPSLAGGMLAHAYFNNTLGG